MADESGNLVTQAEAAERRMAETAPAPPSGEVTPARMLEIAVQQGADLSKLEKLMDLQERWEAAQGEKAFNAALAAAQDGMPIVPKSKHVQYPSNRGPDVDYWHADYGVLVKTIKPHLSAQGLSYRHRVKQEAGMIHVECVLSLGQHSESVSLSAPPDDSGGKNTIQQTKSTITYLKRATFEAVTGAATEDDDDDGHAYAAVVLISDEDRERLEKQLDELGATDEERRKFVSFLAKKTKREIETLADLPATALPAAKQALAAKRRAQGEAKPAPEPQAGETVSEAAWYQAKDGSGRYECHGGDPTSEAAATALFERLKEDLAPRDWTADEASIALEIAEANRVLIDGLPKMQRDALQAALADIPAGASE